MPSTTDLPTGTVTYFFSDVQDSTGLLQRLGAVYKDLIERHAEIIRPAIREHAGTEIRTEGDSFFAVFESAPEAVAASIDIQVALKAEPWPEGGTIAVRIGLHTGTAELGHDDYVGIDVHRAARISDAGHGGQIVLSDSVRALAPEGDFTDLGEHSLRGLERPEHLYQLDVDGLPQAFPPLRTQSSRPNNLPTLTSHIIGRQTELAELGEMIAANRLVTITGPGGIGKTRLALETAANAADMFDKGVFLVDLAPVRDAELVPSTIESTVGVASDNGGLGKALVDGARLLVLDNFEQVTAAASSVADLLAAAAPLKMLITSQVPLRISGEQVYKLQPLAADNDGSPAAELFDARARQSDPGFELAAHETDVLELVDALDGVPLAIELAAARANVLTPAEINARLGTGVLKTSRSDAPERHRSLAAAVEWSYELLKPSQQGALNAMSVFRGGATLASLQAITGVDPLDDLGELVDRSLVEAEIGNVGKRFDLLAPVQLFVSERLENGEDLAANHAAYFLELCQHACEPLEGEGLAHWLAVLDDEHDNISAALDHFLESGSIDEGLEVLGSVWRFFHSTGRLGELDLWLDRFFTADSAVRPSVARTRALLARAGLHYWRSQWKESVGDYEAALTMVEDLDDKPLLAKILSGLSITRGMAQNSGEMLGDPVEPAERARKVFEEIGDQLGVAVIDFTAIFFETLTGSDPKPPSAAAMLDLLDKYPGAGPHMSVRINLALSEIYLFHEDYESARSVTLESLRLAEQVGDIFYMGMAMRWLGVVAVEIGDPDLGAHLEGAGAAAVDRAGGAYPPTIVPITSALDRARAATGPDADKAYAEGKEMSLIDAITLAKTRLADPG